MQRDADDLQTGRRVLVTDDDGQVLTYITRRLGQRYSVTPCRSGAEALAAFRHVTYGVLLTDVRMPGIDGIQLLKTVKEVAPRCQVILMSGQSDIGMVMDGINHGAFAFVTKPVDIENVFHRVAQAMTQVRSFENQDRVLGELKSDLLRQTAFSQRLSSLAALAGSIGHELAQPLSGISVYAQTLWELIESEDFSRRADAAELVRKIHAQIDRATDVVSHVRDLTAAESQSYPEPLDLRQLLERAVDLFRVQLQSKGISLSIDVPEGTVVETHRHRFEQIVTNLVANARDSLVRKQEQSGGGPMEIRLRAQTDGRRVYVDVTDTGLGVESDMRGRIFEPFVTNKQHRGGSGLGLFICRELLKQMGGGLDLRESSGEGCTFRLELTRGETAS